MGGKWQEIAVLSISFFVLLSLAFIRIATKRRNSLKFTNKNCFFPLSSFVDIETGCLEEKNKRDHFTQLVLACLVSYT